MEPFSVKKLRFLSPLQILTERCVFVTVNMCLLGLCWFLDRVYILVKIVVAVLTVLTHKIKRHNFKDTKKVSVCVWL